MQNMQKTERLGKELIQSIEKLEQSSSLPEKLAAGRELNEAFVRFTVFNLKHMAKEEQILNKILGGTIQIRKFRQSQLKSPIVSHRGYRFAGLAKRINIFLAGCAITFAFVDIPFHNSTILF